MPEHVEYIVEATSQGYTLLTASGGSVMVCSDRGSAEHYAAMLNKAFEAGYKRALRDKRNNHKA